jgi:hypothetical protein
LKSWPCAVTRVENSFDGLDIGENSENNAFGAKFPSGEASDLTVAPKRALVVCQCCGKKFADVARCADVAHKCAKCRNGSFVHTNACKSKPRNASI